MSGRGNIDKGMFNPANEQVDDTMSRIDVRNHSSRGSSGGVSTSTRGGRDGEGTSSNVGGGEEGEGGGGGGEGEGGCITSMTKEQEEALSFWSRDLDSHYSGTFSIAVLQANKILEDYSQVEVGKKATFVGIYDGHGGTLTAEYVCDNLTQHLMGLVRETKTMSEDNLIQAFLRTDSTWLDYVGAEFDTNPVLVAACGTCCLVGVVWKGNLYVANVGDSRAIIGRVEEQVDGSLPKITFEPLTRDDNVRDPKVRAEVQDLYPDDPDIVIYTRDALRIKGRLQVSKAIGDASLKLPEFNLNKYKGKELNKPVRPNNPAVTARPIPTITPLGPQDRFVIFATDGLWDQLSNKEAAEIVHQNPQEGIAARLIREALVKAAGKAKKSYDYILNVKVESGLRRQLYFDDMTVVVLFLNEGSQGAGIQQDIPLISVKGGKNQITEDVSSFNALDELVAKEEEDMPGLEGGDAVASVAREENELAHVLARMVCLHNLPYGSSLLTLYPLLLAPLQDIEFGPYGFYARLLFHEVHESIQFIDTHRDRLILLGKLCCVSYAWEHDYRREFKRNDLFYNRQLEPFTIYVSGFAMDISVESISLFFIHNRLHPRSVPILQVKRHTGSLFALVVFTTIEDCNMALKLNGEMLHGRRLSIKLAKHRY